MVWFGGCANDGGWFTVMVALPLAVPRQLASVTETMVYVVDDPGVTERVAVVPLTFCVAPSDQTMAKGTAPPRVALMVAEEPAQMVALPLTAAVGLALTVTTAGADSLLQPAALVT